MSSAPPHPAAHGRAALFVGLATLDVIQLVDRFPRANQKVRALAQTVAAGGPASNAAVLYACLGGAARLLTGIGSHPLAAGITADLDRHGVRYRDQAAGAAAAPAVSTIVVTRGTGERAVVSTNAGAAALTPPAGLDRLLDGCGAVLIDGHHPGLALAAAGAARASGVPTVLDGGSVKPGTEQLLPLIDVAVCSADFRPPGCQGTGDTLAYLHDHQVRWAAVTDGPHPVRYSGPRVSGTVPVPHVEQVADTLGAGDFFHGALVYALAGRSGWDAAGFEEALGFAAATAARSTASFGTRQWLAG